MAITWLEKIDGLDLANPRKNVNADDMNQIKTTANANESAIASHGANTSNPHSVTKAQVGLSNVDNTADASKPVSTAIQTALDLKSPLASPTFTGTVSGITKSMVGLGSVDNTSDAGKPVSTAQQTAIDAKVANDLTASTTVAPSKTAVNTGLALRLLITNMVVGETPSGTKNEINTVFTIANSNPSMVWVYSDGVRVNPSGFSITGTTLTMVIPPDNSLLIDYIK